MKSDHAGVPYLGFCIQFFNLGICPRSPWSEEASDPGTLTPGPITSDLIWVGPVPSTLLRWG